MSRTVEEIGAKMDALGLWEAIAPYNWAVKPRGTAFPYFCTVLTGEEGSPVKVRFLMLEGWQTMHDYVRTRVDRNFGFYSSPMEMPHLELVVLRDGARCLFRHDEGYLPVEADARWRALAGKILWEAFGVMMRVESDSQLTMRFSEDRAIFARVEAADGTWSDSPLPIPDPRPHVEKIVFASDDIKRAQDLPIASEEALSVDFRMLPGVVTKDPRPRCVYSLVAVDPATRELVIDCRATVAPDGGLKGLWEAMPAHLLKSLIARGRVPGELRLCSGRVFRMLRPLGVELPFKLSLHDELPELKRG